MLRRVRGRRGGWTILAHREHSAGQRARSGSARRRTRRHRRPRLRRRHQPAGAARRRGRPGVRRAGRRRRRRPRRHRRAGPGASAPGVPTFVCRVARLRQPRDDWDAALTDAVAAYEPDLVVLGRLHEAGRAGVPRRGSAAGSSTPTPRCCRRFPGMHGAAGRAGVRRQGHRRTLFVVDDGRRHRADRRAGAPSPVRDDDDEDDACTSGSRSPSARMLVDVVGRMARDGLHRHRTGRSPSRERADAQPADDGRGRSGGPWSRVYDKTGLEELARGLHAAGVAIVSTGSTAARIAGRRRAGHPGRGADRLPRVPRRPGQDPAPAGARRASSPTPRNPDHVAPARRARHRAVRPGRRQPLPVPETVASGATPGRVRRADRHRRPVDGARRRQEPRQRRRRHRPRRATPTVLAAVRGRRLHPRRSGSGWPPRRSCTPRRTTSPSRPGWAASSPTRTDGTGFPAWTGATWDQRGGAALRREPAPARRALRDDWRPGPRAGRAAARQGDVLQQLRRRRRRPCARAYDFDRAGRRDHQARQPVRHRGRRRHRRGAPQGARVRPGVGVRRRHRRQPPGDRRDGRAGRRDLHRGRRRARLRATRRSRSCSRKKNIRLLELPAGTARRDRRRVPADQRRAAGADRDRIDAVVDGRRAAATTRRAGRWSAGDAGRRGDARRPGVRLAGDAAR